MKKVIKFVKGRRDDKKDGGITPSQSGELLSPSQTPEDERFLGLDNASGYIVDFCGKDKSLTKLHKAAWQGNLEKLKNALKKIDIDVVDRHNRTALHFAVVQGHPNIVWFLLGNNARHTICDDEGRTALLKAVECGHKECLNLLLERGANINHADFSGITGIHIATKQGSLEIANILIQKGADIDMANNSGEYPIHTAIRSQNKDMAQILLGSGASVNAVDRENRTPLMLAAKSGNIILAQLCFENGAQLFVVDSNGWTAEDYALLGGHQAVASEMKALMVKKDAKPTLETHTEEDETEVTKSDQEQESTWNDSHLSDGSHPKAASTKIESFLRKLSNESNESGKVEKDGNFVESPGSGVVPPPCQPPRSWEIIEAGMLDEATAEGAEPKRRSITALGSLHSRKESFTDTSGQNDCPKYTLSLNRRKDPKKGNTDVKQRFSFNEEETLRRSPLSDDFSLLLKEDKDFVKHTMPPTLKEENERIKSDSGSDWDSHLSSILESGSLQANKTSVPNKDQVDGTFGRNETMKEEEEIWVADQSFPAPPPGLPEKVEEETEVSSSSWDSGESFQNEPAFPPPPNEFELGVDMARSRRKMRGISIDHGQSCVAESKVWMRAYDEQSHSLDSVGEKETETIASNASDSSKIHSRQPSIASHKWHSAELPQQQRPSNRLVDANRRISQQLECYDQALRELAESPYAKKQDAIISTLRETTSSKIDHYYSLPSSKLRRELHTATRPSTLDYGMSLPPRFSLKTEARSLESSGPQSLPLPDPPLNLEEVENNERLGLEEKSLQAGKLRKPSSITEDVENFKPPMLDDISESEKNDRKTKRHMLLAMRDVKHAVQVTASLKSSLDEHVLSPLTKVDGKFDLSVSLTGSEDASPSNEQPYFCNDTEGLIGRQGTVIERSEFQPRSSPSDSGDEPTLWLQEKVGVKNQTSAPTSDDEAEGSAGANFSPLGVVYKELRAERRSKQKESSNPGSDKPTDHRTPSAAFQRLQRLDSSSDNEDSFRERKDSKIVNAEAIDCSPDVSFSSGPIEPLGKDSGSDPESSHQDPIPVHQFSLKKHHKWLKEKLQNENKERHQLEEVAAQLAEKTERLQYELADAREATKSRDEIIALLQGQLARMETAYTKSLEESVHCRLQLTTLEHEILHLKELCAQYEDERESRVSEGVDKQCSELVSKVRELEEEREGLSRVVVRLEQENRTLERKVRGETKEENLKRTERCGEGQNRGQNCQPNDILEPSRPTDESDEQNTLKRKIIELESQIRVTNDVNKQLESRLEKIHSNQKLSGHAEINESISLLNKKNYELENQLHLLIGELRKSKRLKCKKHDYDESSSNSESKDSSERPISGTANPNDKETHTELLKKENMVLHKTIQDMRLELSRLKNMPNSSQPKSTQDDLLKEDEESESSEIDGILKDSEELIDGLQHVTTENKVPKEVEDLKKEVQGLKEALDEAKKGDVVMESHMNRLRLDGKLGVIEAKNTKENALAWSNLYGIKQVQHRKFQSMTGKPSNGKSPAVGLHSLMPLDKDSEEFIELKVRELEDELEKAKEEILRQRVESNMKMQEILAPKTDHLQVFKLKHRVLDLEREISDEREARNVLDRRVSDTVFGLKENKELRFEIDSLKSLVQREYVPKENFDAAQFKVSLAQTNPTAKDTILPISDQFVRQCETLAKEQHRAEELERRLAREASNSKTHNMREANRTKPLSQQKARVFSGSNPSLDEEVKAKLAQQLEDSIKRYYEAPAELESTSPMQEDLLHSKFLC